MSDKWSDQTDEDRNPERYVREKIDRLRDERGFDDPEATRLLHAALDAKLALASVVVGAIDTGLSPDEVREEVEASITWAVSDYRRLELE